LTFAFEVVGAVLSFLVFSQDYSFWDAWGISIFHSIAAFNNSGFDILGNLQNLIPYSDSILLNLVTAGLIICGGIGFLVILDIKKKKRFKKLTLHSKVVITMSIVLILVGTILLKSTENITWLQAFFHSVSARTAGFSTTPLGEFTNAGLFVLVILMFIGASPGSTGGGIKTSTFFVLITVFRGIVKNQPFGAFKRRISNQVIMQAFNVVFLSLMVVVIGTLLLCVTAPECTFIQILFEVTSAFGTVGLSTGITPYLNSISKFILILIMFIGRLGAMTVATMIANKKPRTAVYSVEDISIG
jgi:trk system potassium uptake protein TrkH